MILMVTIASFSLDRYNSYIGFKDMADSAKESAEQRGIEKLYYYNYPKLSYMDAYIGSTIRPLYQESDLDSLIRSGESALIFFRNKDVESNEELKKMLESTILAGESGAGYQWRVISDNPIPE